MFSQRCTWGFRSSGVMLLRQSNPICSRQLCGLIFMEILTVEDDATTLPRNVGIRVSIYSMSYRRRKESSGTILFQFCYLAENAAANGFKCNILSLSYLPVHEIKSAKLWNTSGKLCCCPHYPGHCMLLNIRIRWWTSKYWEYLNYLVERVTANECEGKKACFNSAYKDILIQGFLYVGHFIISNDCTAAMIYLNHSMRNMNKNVKCML
jgi:hypothetical protein